jgi:hypothetical protein
VQVKYIRQKHGDYFGITVAGYPGECRSSDILLHIVSRSIVMYPSQMGVTFDHGLCPLFLVHDEVNGFARNFNEVPL